MTAWRSARLRARACPSPSKSPAETRRIMKRLGTQHPNADTELHFTNAYELLVATILSAQCTDERVNQVTPALFARYPDARALARATTDELEPQIQSTGFFRAKSRSLVGMATEVVETHGGEVPRTMEALVALPGVGTKDGQRRARPRARRAGTSRRSPCASRRQPDRHRQVRRSRRSSSSSSAPPCRRPRGRARPTRSSCTAGASASRARSAIGASSAPTATSMRT